MLFQNWYIDHSRSEESRAHQNATTLIDSDWLYGTWACSLATFFGSGCFFWNQWNSSQIIEAEGCSAGNFDASLQPRTAWRNPSVCNAEVGQMYYALPCDPWSVEESSAFVRGVFNLFEWIEAPWILCSASRSGSGIQTIQLPWQEAGGFDPERNIMLVAESLRWSIHLQMCKQKVLRSKGSNRDWVPDMVEETLETLETRRIFVECPIA